MTAIAFLSTLVFCDGIYSLRVAVPSPRGKTGGRERLRKPDTNRVMWRHSFAWKYIMVSYWIKAASDTFENIYWLKQIDLVFISATVARRSGRRATRTCSYKRGLRDVWNWEISRTMAYTTRNTVSRLVRKELHLNPVVPNDQWKNKPINQAPEI